MKIARIICLLLSLQVTALQAGKPENLQLFLLIGQSNMAGRGNVTAADKKTHPRIFMLNKVNEWVPATDPLHFDKPGIAGSGLGSEFARQLADAAPDANIGLIPCAFGGTSVKQWHPGGKLYKSAVARTKEAEKNGKLRAILWHQGESDFNPKKVPRYAGKFNRMITALRKDLDAGKAPLLIGELGYYNAKKQSPELLETFNGNLAELADENQPAAVISAKGLEHKGDGTHFKRASLIEFGKRYDRAFLDLANKK